MGNQSSNTPSPAVARAALRLLDTRVGGRYITREQFRAAPPLSDEQALNLAIRLELDDPEALRQGALMLKSRMTRGEIEALAGGAAR